MCVDLIRSLSVPRLSLPSAKHTDNMVRERLLLQVNGGDDDGDDVCEFLIVYTPFHQLQKSLLRFVLEFLQRYNTYVMKTYKVELTRLVHSIELSTHNQSQTRSLRTETYP